MSYAREVTDRERQTISLTIVQFASWTKFDLEFLSQIIFVEFSKNVKEHRQFAGFDQQIPVVMGPFGLPYSQWKKKKK